MLTLHARIDADRSRISYNVADEKGEPVAQDLTSPPDTERDAGDEHVTIKYISSQEAAALLDRQAREYLGMSGDEFKRQYREGTIAEPESANVLIISFLIPLSED